MFYQERDILGPCTKRRDFNAFEFQNLAVEILEQFSFLHQFGRIPLQRDDQANVNRFSRLAADPPGLPFIHEIEDLHLIPEARLFNLFDEDRTPVCQFKETALRRIRQPLDSPVETEQNRLQLLVVKDREVDRHEGLLALVGLAQVVDILGNSTLPDTGLADDHNITA